MCIRDRDSIDLDSIDLDSIDLDSNPLANRGRRAMMGNRII